MRFAKTLTVMAAAGMMLACASAPATGGTPAWVHRGGGAYDAPNGKGFYAVGIGTSKDKSMRRTASHNDAFKEMAAIFGKHVTNLYKKSSESVSDGEAENVEVYQADITKSLVDVKLVGVNIINHWEHPDGSLYSLAYLNLDAFGDNLEKMNDLDKRAAAAIRARAASNFEDLNAELEKARGN